MDANIPSKAKIKIHWKTTPYDYSSEKVRDIISLASEKYNVDKNRIIVDPVFKEFNDKGEDVSISHSVIDNIQDPIFQQELFKTYIKEKNIENCDFEKIKEIDAKINSQINYEVYDKYKNYSIKTVRWRNFLSYDRTDNYFDFTNLSDIVLLTGEPKNQSGKTTFACDLLHFLLFGKTSKATTNEKIFNKNLPEETEVFVEGKICIDGEDYIIRRTLTRPQLSKRTSKSKTIGKVEYYKVVGQDLELLEDYVENQQEESTQKTNKIIKEAIGVEQDFDMIICATSSNLDDLIEKKDAERGRLLSKWIGLLPLEEKDALARNEFNKSIKPYLISNTYNSEELKQEIKALGFEKEAKEKKVQDLLKEMSQTKENLETEKKRKKSWEDMRVPIDNSIADLDINTIEKKLKDIISMGKQSALMIQSLENELQAIGEVNFIPSDYDKLANEISSINANLAIARENCKHTNEHIKTLQKGEFCPTCHRKLENVDNSKAIAELQEKYNDEINNGKLLKQSLDDKTNLFNSLKEIRDKFDNKSKLELQLMALKAKKAQLTSDYKEEKSNKDKYKNHQEALANNNKCNNQIMIIDSNINNLHEQEKRIIYDDTATKSEIKVIIDEIGKREKLIQDIAKEQELIFNWNVYLDMVGRNGISKMVLRKVLPVINAQMRNLLSDVCDFDIELKINNKNEINFWLIRNGVEAELCSGSGFEKTVASLALRSVLGSISRLPKMDGLILDEIFGKVSIDNLPNIKTLLDRIVSTHYKYVINITHLEQAQEWSTQIITVSKNEDGISKISVSNK